MRAAAQYGVEKRFLDLCTFDVTHNPLRCGSLFDAIITDPPCRHFLIYVCYQQVDMCPEPDGVRAGAKKLGRKPTNKRALKERDPEIEEMQKKGCVCNCMLYNDVL